MAPRVGLAKRRKSRGLTQEALAEKLRVGRTTVQRWEIGETEPQPWQRPRLAKELDVSEGRFVATCWIGQIYKHIPDPKPAYVADWADMPQWQKETDCDIFDRIEMEVRSPFS